MTREDAMFLMEYMPDIWEKWAENHSYDADTWDGIGNFFIDLGEALKAGDV